VNKRSRITAMYRQPILLIFWSVFLCLPIKYLPWFFVLAEALPRWVIVAVFGHVVLVGSVFCAMLTDLVIHLACRLIRKISKR